MAKTLADMTAEERTDCVGMWCDNLVSTADNPHPVVLACVQGERCWILHTDLYGEWSCFSLVSVSPRFDLPRAWTPDGEPIPAKEVRESIKELTEETWEYAAQAKTGSKWEYMQDGFFRDAWFSELREAKDGARELRSIGRETRIVRRRVSPVEVVNE